MPDGGRGRMSEGGGEGGTEAPQAPPGPPRAWHLARFPDYRRLWISALAMIIAQQLRFVALPAWLLGETGQEEVVGIVGAVQLPVQIVSVLWGGVLADRLDRRWLMAGCNAFVLAMLVALAAAETADLLDVWVVYAAIGVLAAMQVMVAPARATITPRVVPRRHLSVAVTVDTGTQIGGWILGGLFGIGVFLLVGIDVALWLAAAFAAVSMILPLRIRTPARVEEGLRGGGESQIRSVFAGARFIARHPILPGLFSLDWGITVVSYYREIMPLLATGLFMAGAASASALSAANAIGAALGVAIALVFVGVRAKGLVVLGASCAYALLLFGLGVAPALWLGLLIIGGLGAADAVTVAVRQTTVQLTTPDEMRGRAFSFMVLAAQTANNLGIIWIGFWAGSIGASNTMLLGGALGLGASLLIGLAARSIRKYRAPLETDEPAA